MALQHAHLQHLGQAQRTVAGQRAELGRLDLAPAQRRDDLVDGQLKDGRPQLLIDLRSQPPGMKAHAVQILHPRDRTLEPAKGRRGQRPVQQRMHLQAGRCIDLLQQRLTTAVPMPGQQRQRIHAECGPTAPQPDRRLAQTVERERAVTGIQPATGNSLGQRIGGNHLAGRQNLQLQPPLGQHAQHVGQRRDVGMKIILQRPGRLAAPDHRLLGQHRALAGSRTAARQSRGRQRQCRHAGGTDTGALQDLPPSRHTALGNGIPGTWHDLILLHGIGTCWRILYIIVSDRRSAHVTTPVHVAALAVVVLAVIIDEDTTIHQRLTGLPARRHLPGLAVQTAQRGQRIVPA